MCVSHCISVHCGGLWEHLVFTSILYQVLRLGFAITRPCTVVYSGCQRWTHLISMLFCHLGHANSVRDISNGLRSITGNIKHLGCSHAPAKSTVSYVNEHRNYVIFQEFYYVLADYFRTQIKFSKPALKKIKRKVFLLDASVISLSLSLYDWAKFRTRKGAVKLHLLLDSEGCLPAFADLTQGKVHEIKVARKMRLPLDSILVFDMGYYDFSWLYIGQHEQLVCDPCERQYGLRDR